MRHSVVRGHRMGDKKRENIMTTTTMYSSIERPMGLRKRVPNQTP